MSATDRKSTRDNQRSVSLASGVDWDQVEKILVRYEDAWRGGEQPRIEDYLPAGGPERRAVLIELVHEDLEYRIGKDEAARVETYLKRYPELRGQAEVVLDLLATEFKARRRHQQTCSTREYEERFPDLSKALAQRLRDAVPTTLTEPPDNASSTATVTEAARPPSDRDTAPARQGVETKGPPRKKTAGEFPVVPGYEIQSELGRGGMGVVYKARDANLKRTVALKMILAGAHASEDDLARFRREAEAVAALQHPNIVQIHEIGAHEGLPYFSLEFVDGGNLGSQCRGKKMPADRAAELVETLARAMDHAHQRGILHRDLKPANVLLQTAATQGADRRPDKQSSHRILRNTVLKITDFGLAKHLAGETEAAGGGLTRSGDVLGTPSYMAPEQAEGRSKEMTSAVDVYALGAILYELVTGRPPFQGAVVFEVLNQVVHDDPVPPRRVNPAVPADLETICLKCLEKAPTDRYASALALANDLALFRAGEPISGRRQSPLRKIVRRLRRHPRAVAATVLVVAILAVGSVVLAKALHARRVATLDSSIVSSLRETDGSAEWVDRVEGMIAELARLDSERAAARRPEVADRLATFVDDYLRRDRLTADDRQRIDGALVLLAARNPDRAASLRDQRNQRIRQWETVFDFTAPFTDWNERFDKAAFATAAGSGLPTYLRLRQRDQVAEFHAQSAFFSIDGCDGDVEMTAVLPQAGDIELLLDGQPVLGARAFNGGAHAMAFAPDSQSFAVAGAAGTVIVWRTTGTVKKTLPAQGSDIISLAYMPNDGKLLATGNLKGEVRLWDLDTGSARWTWSSADGLVTGLAFSPDGRRLAACRETLQRPGPPRAIALIDPETGQQIAALEGHTAGVLCVAFSPDGKTLASGGVDATVRLWDIATLTARTISPGSRWVTTLAFSPDGKSLAVGTPAGLVSRLDVTTGTVLSSWEGYAAGIYGLSFTPDGKTIAAIHDMGWLNLWDVSTQKKRCEQIRAHMDRGVAAAFAPDGLTLATGDQNGAIKLWNTASLAESGTVKERFRRGGEGYGFRLTLVPEEHESLEDRDRRFGQRGGEVKFEILRDRVSQRETTRTIPAGKLRLRVRREGNQLTFQINEFSEMTVWDMWPLPADSGHFGIKGGAGTELISLTARAALIAHGSALERGDGLYGEGRFEEALDFYESQGRTASMAKEGREIRREADCKRGLCLLQLNRKNEAGQLFAGLAEDPATDRWVLVAALQLWNLYFEADQIDGAQQVLERIRERFRASRELLLSVVSGDLRDRIGEEFHDVGKHLRRLLFAPPGLVSRLRQAATIGDLLGFPLQDRMRARLHLVIALEREGKPGDAATEALVVLEENKEDMRRALIREDYDWLMFLTGQSQKALEELDEELFQSKNVFRPKTENKRLPWLLERVRLLAHLGQWREAETDLETLLALPENSRTSVEIPARAYLLLGMVREQQNNHDGAQAAWKQGLGLLRPAAPQDKPRAASLGVTLSELIMAARTNTLSDDEAHACAHALALYNLEGARLVDTLLQQPQMLTAMKTMWGSRRGQQLARRIACGELSEVTACWQTGKLGAAELLRQLCWTKEPSPEEDELVWTISEDLLAALTQEHLTMTQAFAWVAACKDNKGLLLWRFAEGKLPGTIQADLSYLLGRRYADHFKKGAEAEAFFTTAKNKVAPESPLGRLAQAEIDRLKMK